MSTAQCDRATETRQFRCPTCSVSRFLGDVTGEAAGVIRIKCPKCKRHVVFDLATGKRIQAPVVSASERELRCGRCRWFLAGIAGHGAGQILLPCALPGCKRKTRFSVEQGIKRSKVFQV